MAEVKRAIDKEKILNQASDFIEFYFDLVWASRKPPLDADIEIWQQYWTEDGRSTHPEIRMECLKQLRIIAEKHPKEYSSPKKLLNN